MAAIYAERCGTEISADNSDCAVKLCELVNLERPDLGSAVEPSFRNQQDPSNIRLLYKGWI